MPFQTSAQTLLTLSDSPKIELKALRETGQTANTYLLLTPTEGLLFDPSRDPGAWGDDAGRVTLLVATHGHYDHIGAADRWRKQYEGLPLIGHESLDEYLENPKKNVSTLFGGPRTFRPADGVWEAGESRTLETGDNRTLRVTAESYPGHTSSDLVYFIELDDKVRAVITGDVTFADNVGRSDLDGGSPRGQIESLRRLTARLQDLPQDALACFGHGGAVTVGELLARNSYLQHFTGRRRGPAC